MSTQASENSSHFVRFRSRTGHRPFDRSEQRVKRRDAHDGLGLPLILVGASGEARSTLTWRSAVGSAGALHASPVGDSREARFGSSAEWLHAHPVG